MTSAYFPSRRTYIIGGLCGIMGTLFYIVATMVPLSWRVGYGIAMLWPVLTIVFAYALYDFIRSERDSVANQLALVFGVLAFTMVAIMLSVQVAVRSGFEEALADGMDPQEASSEALLKALRLVDHGVDVAWDVFIGMSLFFMMFALARDARFGILWGLPGGFLGIALIVLNLATFPWPPHARGLIDVGPMIGIFIIALSARLMVVAGRRHVGASKPE